MSLQKLNRLLPIDLLGLFQAKYDESHAAHGVFLDGEFHEVFIQAV